MSKMIKSFMLKNFKAVSEIKSDLHPGLNFLVGMNGEGKTTIIRAMEIGLEGKQAMPKKNMRYSLIKEDETKSLLNLKLEDTETKSIIDLERSITPKGVYLRGKSDDGTKITEEYLKSIVLELKKFNPLYLANQTPLEQIKYIKNTFKIDTTGIDNEIKEFEEERKVVGREIPQTLPESPEKIEGVNLEGLFKTRREILKLNKKAKMVWGEQKKRLTEEFEGKKTILEQERKTKIADIKESNKILRDDWLQQRENLRKEIENFNLSVEKEKKSDELFNENCDTLKDLLTYFDNKVGISNERFEILDKITIHKQHTKVFDKRIFEEEVKLINEPKYLDENIGPVSVAIELPDEPEYESTEELDKQIENATVTNEKASKYERYLSEIKTIEEAKENYKTLTEQIVISRAKKIEEIKNSDIPFSNLELDDELGLVIKGRPFNEDNFNTAELVRIGTRILIEALPKDGLRTIFIQHGEMLDENNIKQLAKISGEHNVQFIIEMQGKEKIENGFNILLKELKIID